MNKTNVKMNKPVYLCLSFLDIRKIAIHEYQYDYLKPKHRKKIRLCYMDADSFIVHVTSVDIYKDLKEMLKKDLRHLTMNSKGPYSQEKQKKDRANER